MKIYLDSCIVIYRLEGAADSRAAISATLRQHAGDEVLVSDLVRMECLVAPLRRGDSILLAEYQVFVQQVGVPALDPATFDYAAELRARHSARTPDALHLAAAMLSGCEEFWTNDLRLTRAPPGIRFRTLP